MGSNGGFINDETLEGKKVVWDGNWEMEVDWETDDEGGSVEWGVMEVSMEGVKV